MLEEQWDSMTGPLNSLLKPSQMILRPVLTQEGKTLSLRYTTKTQITKEWIAK